MRILNTNNPINIIGRDLGAISANKVESLVEFTTPEAVELLRNARVNKTFVNLLADESKIKTLVIMDSGKVYPSTFNLGTLSKRIFEATNSSEFSKSQ